MKKIVSLLAVLLVLVACHNNKTTGKSNLRILYVGGSADWELEHFDNDTIAYNKSIGERMASFRDMLKQYFDSVAVINAKDYTQELSTQYDVTVMDGTPRPIQPKVIERDEAGNITAYKPAGYLTEDFDRPMVVIGELGEVLGRRIGLKTDWYCLCLDADAHHFKQDHPVFKEPFAVKMTIVNKPTPSDAYHYTYFYDGIMPDSLPMWQVQTKGYKSDPGFRVGMVSRPWGFLDSPDAEYISSGVCAKTLDAVAIGRHGNFLHWGFAASPAYMTPEAQTVLANAIVYIAKFAGQGVIARKYNDRIATREYLKEAKYYATKEAYESNLKLNQEFDQMMLERQKVALAKKEKGETLTSAEEASLSYQTAPPMTFEAFIKRHQKKLFNIIGMDIPAYQTYYDSNRDYFYGGEGTYNLVVDEDVKSLGIPNNDVRLLAKAIEMLEQGNDTDKAGRILSRYTLCNFETPAEWRNWFDTNKDKLFFTETGGWIFLVNSRGAVGNDYHAREVKASSDNIRTEDTDEMNPVSVAAGIENGANGLKKVVVKMKIHPGYHIYANVAKSDPFIATKVSVELPAGYKPAGDLQKPSFKAYNDNGTTIYEDEITFIQEIEGTGAASVSCTVNYQCCDAHICMPPATKVFTLSVK